MLPSARRVMSREILPNVVPTTLVLFTLIVANNILTRGGALVPRRRRLGAHAAVLGQHHPAGLVHHRDGALADDRARHRHHAHGHRAERPRRRAARTPSTRAAWCASRRGRVQVAPGSDGGRMRARFWARRVGGLIAVLFAIRGLLRVPWFFNVIPGGDPAVRMGGPPRHTREHRPDPQGLGLRPARSRCSTLDMMNRLLVKRDLISYQDQTQVMHTATRARHSEDALPWPSARGGDPGCASACCSEVLSGLSAGRWPDSLLTVVSMAGISTPIFWLGSVLLYPPHVQVATRVRSSTGCRAAATCHSRTPRSSGSRTCSCRGSASRSSRSASTRGSCGARCCRRSRPITCARPAPWGCPAGACCSGTRCGRRSCDRLPLRARLFGAAVGGTVILIEPVFGIKRRRRPTPSNPSPISTCHRSLALTPLRRLPDRDRQCRGRFRLLPARSEDPPLSEPVLSVRDHPASSPSAP